MTQQLTLDEGLRQRDAGIASLERHPWLWRARLVAVRLCSISGDITSDDVQRQMEGDPAPHPNAWGALFHDKRFVLARDGWGNPIHRRSRRPEAHARDIKVWRLA